MITVNRRDTIPWHPGLTVRELLETMRFTFAHLIVSVNGTVVHQEAYDTHTIPDGADVRVVHLMAGG